MHVDVGRFDKNMDLAKELGADFKAIPFLTILDADGKALVQQNTEPFETKDESGKGGHDAKKLLAFFTEHQTKPLDAKVVREAAFAQAKAANKRVFLHYGAPWCVWCRRLEEWLARPEIAALLATDFIEVKIDQDRMTGGKEMLLAKTAKHAQDWRFDVPCFGLRTLESMAEGGVTKAALEADAVILIDKPAVLSRAKELGIDLLGFGPA